MQLDLNLSLLPGSRAKTDAWLFSAMLFPFCLAAGQEKQGLECKPFRGRLRPPLIALLCWCEAGRCCLPWGGGPRPYLVHWWQAAGLYLEQSVSWIKARPLVAGIRLVTSHPALFGTGEHRANTGGDGGCFSHENTDSAHGAKGFVSRQVPAPTCECGGVRDILGARHSGGQHVAVLPWEMA